MPLVEACPAGLFAVVVDVEIVPDDHNATGDCSGHGLHEGDQVRGLSMVPHLGDDLAVGDVEGADEDLCAVADVVGLSTTRPSFAGHEDRVTILAHEQPLLVHTEDRHSLRGGQVPSANLLDLRPEVWILRIEPSTNMMGSGAPAVTGFGRLR